MTWLRGPWLPRLFVLLYLLIGLATLRHSAYGFASMEGGNLALGLLSAVAVDLLLIFFAHGLRNGFRWDYAAGLVLPALFSIYTQWLFASEKAELMMVAPGAAWLGDTAARVQEWRVVLLPAALPVLALVASLAGRGEKSHVSLAAYRELQTVAQNRSREIDELEAREKEAAAAAAKMQDRLALLEQKLAETERRLATTGLLSKLPQQTQAAMALAFMDGNEFRNDAELAKLTGIKAYAISRARKALRENGREKETQPERERF